MEGSPYVNIESSFIPEKSEGNFQNPALNSKYYLSQTKVINPNCVFRLEQFDTHITLNVVKHPPKDTLYFSKWARYILHYF